MSPAPSTPRPRLREEQRLLTRDRILDAARTVFESNGFRGSTVAELVREAGISRATFYLHFTSKEDVADALALQLGPGMRHHVMRLADHASTHDDVRSWIEQLVAVWRSFGPLAPVAADAIRNSPALRDSYLRTTDELGETLVAAMPRNAVQRAHLAGPVLASAIICTTEALPLLFPQTDDTRSNRYMDDLTALWCSVLRIPAN